MIDVLFHDKKEVRKLWKEYYEMLGNEGLNNPLGWQQRQKKNIELIHEMAKVLGYGKEITHMDVDRVYTPIGLETLDIASREITSEILRVLKATEKIEFIPRKKNTAQKDPESESGK